MTPPKSNKPEDLDAAVDAIVGHLPAGPINVKVGKTSGKISRNSPCPCGSGRKYKKCCLLLTKTGQLPQLRQDGFVRDQPPTRRALGKGVKPKKSETKNDGNES